MNTLKCNSKPQHPLPLARAPQVLRTRSASAPSSRSPCLIALRVAPSRFALAHDSTRIPQRLKKHQGTPQNGLFDTPSRTPQTTPNPFPHNTLLQSTAPSPRAPTSPHGAILSTSRASHYPSPHPRCTNTAPHPPTYTLADDHLGVFSVKTRITNADPLR